MRALWFWSILALGLCACESPMNERIHGEARTQAALEKFSRFAMEAEVKWVKGPVGNVEQSNELLVLLYQEGRLHSLPEGQTLEFYATMPSMGHPMEDAGTFLEIHEGIYINKSIRYNMPGDWRNELWIMDAEFNILDRLEWQIYF